MIMHDPTRYFADEEKRLLDAERAAGVDGRLIEEEMDRQAAEDKTRGKATAQFAGLPQGAKGRLQMQVDRAILDDGAFSRPLGHKNSLVRKWRQSVWAFGRRPCRGTRRAFVHLTKALISRGYLLGGEPAAPTPGLIQPEPSAPVQE